MKAGRKEKTAIDDTRIRAKVRKRAKKWRSWSCKNSNKIVSKILCSVDRASPYNHVKKNQLVAKFLLSIFRQPLHVSGVSMPIIRRYNRRYTTIGNYYSFRWLSVVLVGLELALGGWQCRGGSFLLVQAIFEPYLFPYKYPNILKPSQSSYQPAYEDGTDRVFRNFGI
jgi:hypothetical protein